MSDEPPAIGPDPVRPREGYINPRSGRCRSPECGRWIVWWVTPKGAASPHDHDGTSHFATCPGASAFRRRKAQLP